MTRREVLQKIKEFEEVGHYDAHVDPIDYSIVKPLDTFPYKRGILTRLKIFLQTIFIVNPFIWYVTHIQQRLKVVGKENLKGLKAAVITCNHVEVFDCLAAIRVLNGRRPRITSADFNNRNDFLGEMMRAGGLLPIGNSTALMRKFNEAVYTELQKKRGSVMFYPEQSMWWHYHKPRPFKRGAFHFATVCGVPVLPFYLTYRPSGKFDKEGLEIEWRTLHILPPVYANPDLNERENIEYMLSTTQLAYRKAYEEIYSAENEK